MKRSINTKQTILCAAALSAAVLAVSSAQANPITGSIGFGASGVTVNSDDLASATSFTVIDPVVSDPTGTFASVPEGMPVKFNGFVFNPAIMSITPLWTFDIGKIVYSFDVTSDSSSFNAALDEWDIGGKGIAMVSGYTPTTGTWNVNLSQSGDSFVFDSSAAAKAVTDGGSTLACLGGAFLCLGAVGRKVRG